MGPIRRSGARRGRGVGADRRGESGAAPGTRSAPSAWTARPGGDPADTPGRARSWSGSGWARRASRPRRGPRSRPAGAGRRRLAIDAAAESRRCPAVHVHGVLGRGADGRRTGSRPRARAQRSPGPPGSAEVLRAMLPTRAGSDRRPEPDTGTLTLDDDRPRRMPVDGVDRSPAMIRAGPDQGRSPAGRRTGRRRASRPPPRPAAYDVVSHSGTVLWAGELGSALGERCGPRRGCWSTAGDRC